MEPPGYPRGLHGSSCNRSTSPDLASAVEDREDLDSVTPDPVPDAIAALDQFADGLDFIFGDHPPGLRGFRKLPYPARVRRAASGET